MEIRALTALSPAQLERMGDLNTDHALNCHPEMPSYLQAYEGDVFLGALSLFTPQSDEAELAGFVPPEHRRKGVFTALVRRGEEVLRPYGFQSLLFPCPGDSPEGAAVARRWGLELDHSEYLMFHRGPRPACPAGLTMAEAEEGYLEELVALYVAAFGDDPEDSRRTTLEAICNPALLCRVFRADGALVGAASVNLEAEVLSIFGVAVHPALQGRGWGKKLLSALLSGLPAERKVSLEVDSTNERALRLYQGCGFVTVRREDYFQRSLAEDS